jgi:insertion element IS1 protein InsB
LSETLLPAEAGDVLELDELWSFVGSKSNERWVWIALRRQTRQIIACFVGDRWAESARALRERIPPGCRCRASRSDFWLAYQAAFPRRTRRLCGKAEGQTNHAERWFCTLRQRLGRFVRKTLSFSKSERMHEIALRLFIHQYNQQPIL